MRRTQGTIGDRLISMLCYITFGMFSIIWLIFAHVTNRSNSPYLQYNMYQAVFVSVVFAVISLLYSFMINLLSVVPILGRFVREFDVFFNQTPVYFSTPLSGLFVTMFLIYLCLMVILNKRPYIPYVSEIIKTNFGG